MKTLRLLTPIWSTRCHIKVIAITVPVCITLYLYLVLKVFTEVKEVLEPTVDYAEWNTTFEGFDNVNGAPYNIVPNIVHLIRYNERLKNITFIDAVNLLSLYKNHNPPKIYIHNNLNGEFVGKYWERLKQVAPEFMQRIEYIPITVPTTIYGQPFDKKYWLWHASDVLRIDVLRQYGGIFLDNDVYVVNNLNEFRKYEMTLGDQDHDRMGTMVLIAHKNARFLKLWKESYKHYVGNDWFFNAGEKPKQQIINHRPELVHLVPRKLGVHDVRKELFTQNWEDWRSYYTLHTQIRFLGDPPSVFVNDRNATYPVIFDEVNIYKYNFTILDMVLDCCKELLEKY